ncbi:hypothetical protein HID58_054326 [Brassica napus]|uniref:Protein transport protein SEC23 n=1 Tax=Brassica napus TaxID=3708 RepID=A0ABQ8AH87_BRANA|nr:hypothetical protein HID58_054326 [Brassica napus]
MVWPRLLHRPSAVAQILESQKCPSGGELMSLDMLLLDSKIIILLYVHKTHVQSDHYASIRERELASNLQALSPAVSMYYVTSFDVTRYNQNFRLSDSSLLIQFSDATALKKCFRFRNHSEMLGLANTNTQLLDIIGEITAVKRKFYFA